MSGSADGALFLWTWNAGQQRVEGSPSGGPKLRMCGHRGRVRALVLSAELGLSFSASQLRLLCHRTQDSVSCCFVDCIALLFFIALTDDLI